MIEISISTVARRAVLGFVLAAAALFVAPGAQAAPQAEAFVQSNIAKGLDILNNKNSSAEAKQQQFESFLLGLTDMRRIANFTLGQYRRTATPDQQSAFAAAFQNYATAVYQSYFAKYAGQTLHVTGSQDHGPGDTIVTTQLIDPNDHSGQPPLEVDFRVLNDNGRLVVIDFAVAGIWLAITERDQFSAYLGQNGGDINALIKHLGELAKTYR
jgi:phospholipid transport system substrate-binding protein